MDQYGEELYQTHIQGPIEQEMQAPPREFYAARTIPNINFDSHQENYEDYEERVVTANVLPSSSPSSSQQQKTKSLVSVEAAQALLSDRLDDLTEKLAFIKNNITQIRPQPQQENNQRGAQNEDEFDRTTLHTLHHEDLEER